MASSRPTNDINVPKLPHHEQQKLCLTRPPYRQGKKLTAIKAYTINDESVYLLINHVPDIKIALELANMCTKYGTVVKVIPLPDYPRNQFELTYLVKYTSIKYSRIAKKVMDGKNFFGGILHVCYAPELETVDETRSKLLERKREYSFLKSKNEKKESCSDYTKYLKNNFQINTSVLKNLQLPNFSSIPNSRTDHTFNSINIIRIPAMESNKSGNNICNTTYSKNEVIAGTKRKIISSIHKETEVYQLSNTKKLVSNKISSFVNKKRKNTPSQPSLEDLSRPISTKNVMQ